MKTFAVRPLLFSLLLAVAGAGQAQVPAVANPAKPAEASVLRPRLAEPAPPLAMPKGYAVVIGGGLTANNEDVWARLVQLSGGQGSQWVVLATASAAPDKTGRNIADQLERRGAAAQPLPVAPALKWVDLDKAVRDPELLEIVRGAKGVFFSGGAQERIVDTFAPGGRPTPMLQAIWEVYRNGGVVAGTSAGAAIMSTVMFRDPPVQVVNVMKGQFRDGKEVDHGLGFVGPNLFVDQHFLKRGRFGRMIPLMLAKGYKLGLGVDEDCAAVVHGDQVEVIGSSGALVVDLTDAQTNPAMDVLNVTGARLTYLDGGDGYDLGTRQILPSKRKLRGKKLDPNAAGYKPEYNTEPYYVDILGESIVTNAMGYLIDSSVKEAHGLAFDAKAAPNSPLADLGFGFRLYKGKDSLGWYSDEYGAEEYSVANLYLDIVPVRMSRPLFVPWLAH